MPPAKAPRPEAAHDKAVHAKAAQAKAAQAKATQAKAAQAKTAQATATGVFEALGEPVRRRILELLAGGERPVGPLVAALRSVAPISQPAVSQHLRVLLDAGLVNVRAAGTRRVYALDTDGLNAARAWLDRLADPLAPFAQALDALATEVARGRRAGRDNADRINVDQTIADRTTADRTIAASTPDRADEDRRPA